MEDLLIKRLKKVGIDIINIESLTGDNINDGAIINFYDELDKINEKYNKDLKKIATNPDKGFVFSLGSPGFKLLSVGIQNKPIRLYSSKLIAKAEKHEYELTQLMDLPKALAEPIAIFKGAEDNSFALVTEIEINSKKVLAVISVGKHSDSQYNMIRSAYAKNMKGIVNWINNDKMLYVDKSKALEYLRISAPIAEALDKQELYDATNIIENFENPKFEKQINTFDMIKPAPSLYIRNKKNEIMGLCKDNRIYLTPIGFNKETMIHEFTHIWAKAMFYGNPDGWTSIKNLLKDTSLWQVVVKDERYADIQDNEDSVASEVLSRISGKENAAKLESLTHKETNTHINGHPKIFVSKLKKALDLFWGWVGKHMFDIKKFNSVNEITDRVLYDLFKSKNIEHGKVLNTAPSADNDRITHIHVFNGRGGQPYIRCKVDGVQQMGVPVKRRDMEAIKDPACLHELAERYFAGILVKDEKTRSIKL